MIDFQALRAGDRKSLAKAITLLESTRSDHREQAETLIQQALPHSGRSVRIGLTGVPGVGKSTLIESFGSYVINQGHKIAVLAVDPSSTLTGGSILGDKTRMQTLSVNENAFIRPTPAGQTMGGVARRTREAILVCEAAGFDVIIVETVGVGQSETLVSEMTDMFVLMLLPGGGDELQGIKRGIMELADLVLINKADGDMQGRANISAADIMQALRLIKPRVKDWQVPVLTISAQFEKNIDLIWQAIGQYQNHVTHEQLQEIRRQQSSRWLWAETKDTLLAELKNNPIVASQLEDLQSQVSKGVVSPSKAARLLVNQFMTDV